MIKNFPPITIGFLAVFLFSVPVLAADIRSDVLERAAHCNTISDMRAWLDCYYGAAQPARQFLGLPPAPQARQFQQVYSQPFLGSGPTPAASNDDGPGIFDVFNSPKVPPDQFGLNEAKPGPGVNVDRIVDRLQNVRTTGDGFIITLANGQVWKQVDKASISWPSSATSYVVTITHGVFHTFNMRRALGKAEEMTLYKVERVR